MVALKIKIWKWWMGEGKYAEKLLGNFSKILLGLLAFFISTTLKANDEFSYVKTKPTIATIDNLTDIIRENINKNIKSAEYYAQKQINDSYKINYLEGVAKGHNALGLVYIREKKLYEALESLKKSLIISEKIDNKILMGKACNNIGNVYEALILYDEAIIHYKKAILLYNEKSNANELFLANTYKNIGMVYEYTDQYKTALEYYQKAKNIFEKYDNPEGLSYIYYRLGGINRSFKEYDFALYNYNKSKELAEKVKDHNQILFIYNAITNIYIDKKELKTAEKYIQTALQLSEKYKTTNGVDVIFYDIYNNLGEVYIALQDDDKAIPFLKAAENLNLDNTEEELIRTYQFLAQIYTRKGATAESLHYTNLAHNLEKFHQERKDNFNTIKIQKLQAVAQSVDDFKAAYIPTALWWQQQNIWLFILMAGTVVLGFVIYRAKFSNNFSLQSVNGFTANNNIDFKAANINFVASIDVATVFEKDSIAEEKNTILAQINNRPLQEVWQEMTGLELPVANNTCEALFLRLMALHGLAFSKKWNPTNVFEQSLASYKHVFGQDFGDNLKSITHYAAILCAYEPYFTNCVYWHNERTKLAAYVSLAYLKEFDQVGNFQEKLADYQAIYGKEFGNKLASFQEYYSILESVN